MESPERTDAVDRAMLSEREARVALADALDALADRTLEYALGGGASRVDVYMCEARVHRAQADLQRVLAREL